MTPSSVAPPYPRGHVLKEKKKLEICTSSKRLHINFNFLGLMEFEKNFPDGLLYIPK